jgi:hypothetical protein
MLRSVIAPTDKPATANALVALRKAHSFTNAKKAAEHVRHQTGVVGLSDSVWASYESGKRKVSAKHREAIESVFGPMADQTIAVHQPGDLGALLVSQQALIDRLTTQNDLLRQLLELHLPKPGAADPTDIVGADKARQHPLPLAPDEPLPAPEDAAQDR